MAPPRKRSRAGNVSALPGVDLAALLQGQGIDLDSLGPFGRRRPVPFDPPVEDVIFRVRVQLSDVRPAVWRRLEVAGDLTLDELDEVIQAAMGWSGFHLHAFTMGPGRRDPRVAPFVTQDDLEEGESGVLEDDVRFDQVVREVGDRLYHDYDFGDGWEHQVKVEAVLPRAADSPPATCTGGARACPPEDVGGPPGYEEVLDWLRNGPGDDDWARERLDWLPDGFDPAAFDLAETDAAVRLATVAPAGTDGFSEATAELLGRVTATGYEVVGPWVQAALRANPAHDEVAPALVAPWVALLDHVGDGIDLTGAGYLRPASVQHLVAVLLDGGRLGPHHDIMFGKGNREEHVRPVGALRTSATAFGLVRKAKGRLLPTTTGRALRDDPAALLRHIAGRLPLGRSAGERDAGGLLLLATAGGLAASTGDLSVAFASLGWRQADGAQLQPHHMLDLTRTTSEVLELAGWNPSNSRILAHDERAWQLGLVAVRPAF